MSNTPETDAAIIASNGQWSFVLKETCQRLERERNKAVEDATNYFARIGELEKERDEAMEALSGRTVSCAACNHAAIERDEAREALENYIASTVHSCNDECKRPMCVLRRERDEAIRQRDETNTSSKYACDYNYEQKLKAERELAEAREQARRLDGGVGVADEGGGR